MAIARVQTDSRELNQVQSQIISSVQPVLDNPIVNGRLIQSLAIASGSNVIDHGLGRTLLGWIVVRNSASVTFYDTQSSNANPARTLLLTASGAATISLYVF
jgi:hypothetical protein